jgi:hypothetical protein
MCPVHSTCLPEQTSLDFIAKLLSDTNSRRSKQYFLNKITGELYTMSNFKILTLGYGDMDKEKSNVTVERVHKSTGL